MKILEKIHKYQNLNFSQTNTNGFFSSHKNDWKKFETDNKTIALNILYVPYNSEEIRHPYISKHNSKREN